MPRTSIIIPTYNRAPDLRRALQSVQRQTDQDWECLIVDNHSTDDTVEVVRSFDDRRMRLMQIHNDGVVAASRNLGLQHAAGDYVAFLDSDDWWKPRKLEISVRYLEHGAALVYHDLYLVTHAKQRWFYRRARTRRLRGRAFEDLIVNGNAVNNSSVVARRDLLQKVGGYSEERSLVAAEDYDTWLRVARVTDALVRIPRTLGYYWVGSGNLTNPDRTLQLLGVLEERYATELRELGASHSIYWLSYVKARSHYLLGSYEMARKYLAAIHWRRVPASIQVKSLWMSLLIRIEN